MFPVLIVASVFAGAFFASAPSVHAEHCGIQFQTSGYFFEDFESAEYINGFLVLHFKLKTPFNDGRSWLSNLSFVNDECANGGGGFFAEFVNVSPGVQYFSIRFTSLTEFEIWNDETNTREFCPTCVQKFTQFPGYYEVAFLGSIDGGASALHSNFYRISNTAPDPPVKTSTLPSPSGCAPFQAQGYFFDDYERTEYQNGLLVYHFRLDSPYNDGRAWYSQLGLHDADCQIVSVIDPQPGIDTQLTPYIRYYSVRFASSTHYDIWNDENNAIENCPACSVDIPANLPDGSPISYVSFLGFIDPGFGVFLNSTPFPILESDYQQKPDPVIIIPGILGSSDKNGVWMIDPIFHTYDDLIATLEANGYVSGEDLFTMPYDWRQSNVLTALQLRDRINEVQAICQCSEVDLVAHSMGGLVARQYIQSSKYENDVDQLIFLGTPHLGAPKAYLMWEGGETAVIKREDRFLRFILSREARKAGFYDLFDYVNNRPIPTVQQLLPIYDYLRDKGSGILRNYPFGYPQNTFLGSLKDSVDLLSGAGIRITSIVGELTGSTINSIRVIESPAPPKWEHGYPEGFNEKIGDRGLERDLGDATVPSMSSEFIPTDLNKVAFEHNLLPTKTAGLIFKKLAEKDATSIVDSGFQIDLKLLLIQILSPVDVVVIAPDGKKIGKDFATGNEINEIEDAFYSGFLTDNEYITIPNPLDGEYQIQTQGTGSGGSYTIALGYIAEATSTEIEFNGETAPGVIADLDFTFASSTSENTRFEITIDDVIVDVQMCYNLGWVTKRSTKDSLIRDLEKNHLKNFLKRLEREHPKHINDQCYNLLNEDVEWLLK